MWRLTGARTRAPGSAGLGMSAWTSPALNTLPLLNWPESERFSPVIINHPVHRYFTAWTLAEPLHILPENWRRVMQLSLFQRVKYTMVCRHAGLGTEG